MNTRRREQGQAASLLLCFLLSLGVLLGPAHIAQAQERTGTVIGTLTDPSGGVLAGRYGDAHKFADRPLDDRADRWIGKISRRS